MDMYLVRLSHEDENGKTITSYWDGVTPNEELQEAYLIPQRTDANMLAGQLQSIYNEHAVSVAKPRITLTL